MAEDEEENTHPGVRPNPKKYFTKIPNEWFDEVSQSIDNLAELKVILYIARHTWGFGEYGTVKHFTVDELVHGRETEKGRMDHGTGLGETAVKLGLKKAIAHGYLVCKTDERDKARIRKEYGPKTLPMDESEGRDATPDSRNATPEGHNPTPGGHDATLKETQRDPRTIEKHSSKKLLEKNLEKEDARPPWMFIRDILAEGIRVFGEANNAKDHQHRGEGLLEESGLSRSRFQALVKQAFRLARDVSERELILLNCSRMEYLFLKLDELIKQGE